MLFVALFCCIFFITFLCCKLSLRKHLAKTTLRAWPWLIVCTLADNNTGCMFCCCVCVCRPAYVSSHCFNRHGSPKVIHHMYVKINVLASPVYTCKFFIFFLSKEIYVELRKDYVILVYYLVNECNISCI